MKYSQQALDENKAAEEETKRMLEEYANQYRTRIQEMGISPEPKQEEPVLPLAEAEKQVDDELLKQANELVNKYRNTDEYPMMDNSRFAKTKQYLNKL
jgi:hypothetical protein